LAWWLQTYTGTWEVGLGSKEMIPPYLRCCLWRLPVADLLAEPLYSPAFFCGNQSRLLSSSAEPPAFVGFLEILRNGRSTGEGLALPVFGMPKVGCVFM
jgi:hypothetical protein